MVDSTLISHKLPRSITPELKNQNIQLSIDQHQAIQVSNTEEIFFSVLSLSRFLYKTDIIEFIFHFVLRPALSL